MSIKALSGDFAFYGFLDLLQRSVSIIMVPVYTRVLSQKEYGDLDIIIIVTSAIFVIVDMQITAGFTRMYYERQAKGEGRLFVGTALSSRLIAGTVLSAAFIFMGSRGHLDFAFMPSFAPNATAWILACVAVPLTLSYDVLLLQARMLRSKKWFAAGALSTSFLSCSLSAFFAVVMHWGIVSVLLGLLAGKLVGMAVLAWGLRSEVSLRFDPRIFRELIRYTFPLIPGFWLAFASIYSSRFFVFAEVGAEENAILAVCMKIAVVIGMFAIAFESAWQPLAMQQIGDVNANTFFVKAMRLFIAGSVLVMFGVTAFLEPILSILAPPSYSVVSHYFPLFAVGMVLSTCAKNVQLGHQIAKSTHWISLIALITSAVNVGILALLMHRYAIFAAGVAWVIAFAAMLVMSYVTAQRSHRIPYDGRAFALLGAACVMLLILGFAGYRGAISSWVFFGLNLSAGLGLFWLVIESSERRAIKSVVGHWLLRSRAGATP